MSQTLQIQYVTFSWYDIKVGSFVLDYNAFQHILRTFFLISNMQFSIRNKQTREAGEAKESKEAVSKEAIFSLHSSDQESTDVKPTDGKGPHMKKGLAI